MGKAGALLAAGMMVWGLLWGEKEVLAAGTGKLEVRSGEAQIQSRGEVSLHKAVFPGEQSGGGRRTEEGRDERSGYEMGLRGQQYHQRPQRQRGHGRCNPCVFRGISDGRFLQSFSSDPSD